MDKNKGTGKNDQVKDAKADTKPVVVATAAAASAVSALKAKEGDVDNKGCKLLIRRRAENGKFVDAWLSKGGKVVYVGIPKTDNTGTVVAKITSYEGQIAEVERVVSEVMAQNKVPAPAKS